MSYAVPLARARIIIVQYTGPAQRLLSDTTVGIVEAGVEWEILWESHEKGTSNMAYAGNGMRIRIK